MLAKNKSASGRSISDAIGSMPIAVLLLYIAVVAGISISFVRDSGATYSLATQWETSRYAFSTSLGGLATILDLLQKGCLLLLLLRSVMSLGHRHLILSVVALLAFAIYGSVGVLIDGVSLFDMLFGSVPLTMLLIPLCITIAKDRVLVEHLARLAPFASLVSLILALLSIVHFQIICGWGSTVGWCPARDLIALGISFLWVTLVLSDERDCGYMFKVGLCMLSMVVAFLLAGRSWVIQSILSLLLVSVSSSSSNKRMRRASFIICVAVVAFLAIGSVFPDVMGTFTERLNEDTRSGQYEVFFAQVDPLTLILGNGSTAGYVYGTQSNYLYFDNQFLYLAFHYGVIPVLTLVFVLLSVIFSKCGGELGGARFVAIFYMMALLGLSNYYSFDMNVGIVALFISFGATIDWRDLNGEQKGLCG